MTETQSTCAIHAELTGTRSIMRPLKALELIRRLGKSELRALPLDTRIDLLHHAHNPGVRLLDFFSGNAIKQARQAIWLGIRPSEMPTRIDHDMVARMSNWLQTDSYARKSQADWHNMGRNDRLDFLREVARKQCAEYGLVAPPINYEKLDHSWWSDSATLGVYSPWSKSIKISSHRRSGLHDFSLAIPVLMHEVTHYIQAKLVRGYKRGTLDQISDDAELKQRAKLFAVNNKLFLYEAPTGADGDDNFDLYESQPVEAHAGWVEDKIETALIMHPNPPERNPDRRGVMRKMFGMK
ncbi:MAG: hypothetical protein Alpg2KO_21730 [Alphaproteobacteria bacterium]